MPKKITLNDLPNFSGWPLRLLGIEPWAVHRKTSTEIIREFEKEKWQPLLDKVRKAPGIDSIEKVDRLISEDFKGQLACWMGNSLKLMSLPEFQRQYLNLIEKTLKPLMPAKAIVEFGCGYGSIILNLARRKGFFKSCFMAADFVPSAAALTQEIARRQRVEITTGFCDLGASRITDLPIPDGAIIFTSYAVMYIPRLRKRFVQALSKFNPGAVVHLEPCYEHFDPKTLLGLMRQRYVQLNDYNQNLLSLLQEQQRAKKLKILMEKPLVMGNNALLPCSLLVWKPIR